MKFLDDLVQSVAWLGSVGMTILGGVVAYIRTYETEASVRARTTSEHMWAIFRKMFMSFFVGLVYYYGVGKTIQPPLSMALAGVVGCFGAEFLELMWRMFVARVGLPMRTRSENEK